jgi:hypothetical protein
MLCGAGFAQYASFGAAYCFASWPIATLNTLLPNITAQSSESRSGPKPETAIVVGAIQSSLRRRRYSAEWCSAEIDGTPNYKAITSQTSAMAGAV